MKADRQNEYISKYEKACNRMIKLPNGETCTFLDVVEDYVYYFKSDPDRVAKSYGYTPEEFKKFVEENSILSKLVKNTEKNLDNDDILSYRAAKSMDVAIDVLVSIFTDAGEEASSRISAIKTLYTLANRKTNDDKSSGSAIKLLLDMPSIMDDPNPIVEGNKQS